MSQLKVGIVGAGGISNAHLPSWAAYGADITAYSLDGKAPELVERHGAGVAVDSLEELLDAVDVVDICTPTFAHTEVALAAIAAGKDVLCEKPLALTVEDAERIAAAAKDKGVQLYPGHVVRYFPQYAALKAGVDSGEIGEPAVLRYLRVGERPGQGWFADPALSGGIIMDQMIHDLDSAYWIAGEVTTVYARLIDSDPQLTHRGTCTAQVTMTHTSGAISYITGVWGRVGTAFRYSFQVAGTKGLLEFDSAKSNTYMVDSGTQEDGAGGLLPGFAMIDSPFYAEIGEMGDAFTGGKAPRVSASDGVMAVKLAHAANQSIASGRAVSMEEISR